MCFFFVKQKTAYEVRISDWSSDGCSSDLRAHPPTVPQLLHYGDRFADFLAGFKPVRALLYLPDVARLEWARHEAYFAGHADPLDPAALAGMPPERYLALALDLHPRSEEHTSELQSLMRLTYAVFCLKKNKKQEQQNTSTN